MKVVSLGHCLRPNGFLEYVVVVDTHSQINCSAHASTVKIVGVPMSKKPSLFPFAIIAPYVSCATMNTPSTSLQILLRQTSQTPALHSCLYIWMLGAFPWLLPRYKIYSAIAGIPLFQCRIQYFLLARALPEMNATSMTASLGSGAYWYQCTVQSRPEGRGHTSWVINR